MGFVKQFDRVKIKSANSTMHITPDMIGMICTVTNIWDDIYEVCPIDKVLTYNIYAEQNNIELYQPALMETGDTVEPISPRDFMLANKYIFKEAVVMGQAFSKDNIAVKAKVTFWKMAGNYQKFYNTTVITKKDSLIITKRAGIIT